MKVVLLAGGYGTRLSEETIVKPKPMVEIGGKPILWHIMKHYSFYGFHEFIILTGYKGYFIKEYFQNYFLHNSDVTFDLSTNQIEIHKNEAEPWKVTILDTGQDTMTGGRIKRAADYLQNEPFLLTYGDGLSNVNITALLDFHKKHGKKITLTGIQPEGRFGALELNSEDRILHFAEKPKGDGSWINGGFFVCEPQVLNYIKDDTTIFEREPLEKLAAEGELYTFKHQGFWKCMDTLRDKQQLEKLWETQPEWRVW